MNLNQGYSSGGSTNSSQSVSQTFGTQANQVAQQVASQSTANAYNAWREAAEYNARQAQIQRNWQEQMANTVYQRTVADMKKAGINPILAANMGLGTASVSGGSAASISPSQVYNAQTFADSMSASQAQGSSWNQSESGLMTFLEAMGTWVNGMIGAITNSKTIDIAINGIENLGKELGYSRDRGESLVNNMKDRFNSVIYDITGGKYGTNRNANDSKRNYSSGGSKF